jgi:hypothetical protein
MLNRHDYLLGKGDIREYYSQFVTPKVIEVVVHFWGKSVLENSTDFWMNDLPLEKWDLLLNKLPPFAIRFSDLGDLPTKAGFLCVAKEAARQYLDNLP